MCRPAARRLQAAAAGSGAAVGVAVGAGAGAAISSSRDSPSGGAAGAEGRCRGGGGEVGISAAKALRKLCDSAFTSVWTRIWNGCNSALTP